MTIDEPPQFIGECDVLRKMASVRLSSRERLLTKAVMLAIVATWGVLDARRVLICDNILRRGGLAGKNLFKLL